MSQEKSFHTRSRFYDDTNFPYGLRRSGDFTRLQSDILEQYGVALKALCDGERDAVTAEELRFIKVCEGMQEAETDIEKSWISYLTALNRRSEYISYCAAPSSGVAQSQEDSVDD